MIHHPSILHSLNKFRVIKNKSLIAPNSLNPTIFAFELDVKTSQTEISEDELPLQKKLKSSLFVTLPMSTDIQRISKRHVANQNAASYKLRSNPRSRPKPRSPASSRPRYAGHNVRASSPMTHAHAHTRTRAHLRAYTHAHLHTCTHARLHACAPARLHTYTQTLHTPSYTGARLDRRRQRRRTASRRRAPRQRGC